MASPSYNRVIFLGRVGRNPEIRSFANGGKVASFSLAINEKIKNQATGQFEESTMWIECSAFNKGEYGKLAGIVEQYVRKGDMLHIEGKLKIDKWQDKTTGQNRERPKIIVDALQLLGGKKDGGQQQAAGAGYRNQEPAPQQQSHGDAYSPPADNAPEPDYGAGEEIPF